MALLFLSLYTVHIMALHSFITVHIIIILFFLGSPGTIRWLLVGYCWLLLVLLLLFGYWLVIVGYCWLVIVGYWWLLLVGYCWLLVIVG